MRTRWIGSAGIVSFGASHGELTGFAPLTLDSVWLSAQRSSSAIRITPTSPLVSRMRDRCEMVWPVVDWISTVLDVKTELLERKLVTVPVVIDTSGFLESRTNSSFEECLKL